MNSNRELIRRLTFRLGLVLVVLGAAIYRGGVFRSFAPSIGDTWLGVIVGGIGVILLGVHVYLNKYETVNQHRQNRER